MIKLKITILLFSIIGWTSSAGAFPTTEEIKPSGWEDYPLQLEKMYGKMDEIKVWAWETSPNPQPTSKIKRLRELEQYIISVEEFNFYSWEAWANTQNPFPKNMPQVIKTIEQWHISQSVPEPATIVILICGWLALQIKPRRYNV